LIYDSQKEKDRVIFRELSLFTKNNHNNFIPNTLINNIKYRQSGKIFTFSEHIKGLVYSQLTNQTKWVNIEPNLNKIDDLFFNYDKQKILKQPAAYFYNGIFKLKCGNISTVKQMESIHYNIKMFERIEKEHGHIDKYINNNTPTIVARDLSVGKYKLKYVGNALAWEYLRNMGVDGAKPDLHLKRILGTNRLGYSNRPIASDEEVALAVKKIAINNDVFEAEIDALLWNFCADGYGAICKAEPKCYKCLLVEFCNRNA
jgi:hypothetical protein